LMIMNLVRSNKTYRMDNLPELFSTRFKWNGKFGFTGSLIKRPISITLGIYKHYGIIYGFDKNKVLWILENNLNGVECITLKDFLAGSSKYEIETLQDERKSPLILCRAFERAPVKYNARNNNCEHFVNFALNGVLRSFQTEKTECLANFALSIVEISIESSHDPKHQETLKRINDLRKSSNLPRLPGIHGKSSLSSKKKSYPQNKSKKV